MGNVTRMHAVRTETHSTLCGRATLDHITNVDETASLRTSLFGDTLNATTRWDAQAPGAVTCKRCIRCIGELDYA